MNIPKVNPVVPERRERKRESLGGGVYQPPWLSATLPLKRQASFCSWRFLDSMHSHKQDKLTLEFICAMHIHVAVYVITMSVLLGAISSMSLLLIQRESRD